MFYCLPQLFNIEGNNDRDYLNQMERDACLTYLIDQVPFSPPLVSFCRYLRYRTGPLFPFPSQLLPRC